MFQKKTKIQEKRDDNVQCKQKISIIDIQMNKLQKHIETRDKLQFRILTKKNNNLDVYYMTVPPHPPKRIAIGVRND